MDALATARLSSKGRVVIPEEVRKALGLEPGVRCIVLSEADVVIRKRIDAPAAAQVRTLAAKVRNVLRRALAKHVAGVALCVHDATPERE